ncbi:MAG: metallophosphoesterase family protein [Armatimonadetes bacterium]|nr:metallophosphoesterase family protein [Armatimonadota bacterium]
MPADVQLSLRSKQKRAILLLALEVLAVLAGGLILITFFGPAEYNLEGLRILAALKPSLDGQTVVELPPLGTLTMPTHRTPLEIHLTLQSIQPDVLTSDFSLSARDLWSRFASAAAGVILHFLVKQLILGALGAALGVWLLRRPPLRRCLQAAAAGLFLTAALFTATWATYDLKAVREPKFDGIIAFAPRMLALAENTMTELGDFRTKAAELTGNIQNLLSKIEQMNLVQTPAENDIKLLAVADLHNNPVGIDLTLALANYFNVDAVLDAGDLTDYGSTLELKIVNSLRQLKVPYLFSAGNHDSPAISEFVNNLPQGRALEGKIAEVSGIKILGSPDPLAVRPFLVQAKENLLPNQIADLKRSLQKEGALPDLLLVHNPETARAFAGKIPVLVAGHTHRPAIEKIDRSIFINPGTTGAAGTRGLETGTGIPYSAAILYFTHPPGPELRAVDTVKYNPLSGKFSVERQIILEKEDSK